MVETLDLGQGRVGRWSLLAAATDGARATLWATDGTPAGTSHLLDRELQAFEPLGVAVLAADGEGVLVRAGAGGTGLWWVGPNTGQTRDLGDVAPAGDELAWPLAAALEDGRFLFRGRDGAGEELWVTDTTANGTRRLVDLVPGGGSGWPGGFLPFGSRAGFQARSSGASTFDTLWVSDGTSSGTRSVLSVAGARVFPLAGTSDRLIFRVTGDVPEAGVWGTDGTAAGTTLLVPTEPEAVVSTAALPERGALVAVKGAGGGVTLWFTDGTAGRTAALLQEGTSAEARVRLRTPVTASGSPPAVLTLWERSTGWRFRVSDGSEEGTTPFLLPLGPEHGEANPPRLLASDGRGLYWALSDGTSGTEPWVTTLEGLEARQVADLCPGECGSEPFAPRTVPGGGISLAATDGTGRGLWYADLEEAGVLPLVAPGSLEGSLDRAPFGYLTARSEDATGTEPWAARVRAACEADATTLCLNEERFAVRARWATADGGGEGRTVPLTDDTGAFWFFEADNLELVVKVLPGCFPPFDSFWVFASGLTDVEVELAVSDTETNRTNTYLNPLGRPYELIRDTGAFPCS